MPSACAQLPRFAVFALRLHGLRAAYQPQRPQLPPGPQEHIEAQRADCGDGAAKATHDLDDDFWKTLGGEPDAAGSVSLQLTLTCTSIRSRFHEPWWYLRPFVMTG